MKIERTGRALRPAGRRGHGPMPAARRARAPAAEAPAALASVMGIPEAEFTPRVRDAIMALMEQVDALRHELEQVRTRLEVAESDRPIRISFCRCSTAALSCAS